MVEVRFNREDELRLTFRTSSYTAEEKKAPVGLLCGAKVEPRALGSSGQWRLPQPCVSGILAGAMRTTPRGSVGWR